jgi:hypothetical protein
MEVKNNVRAIGHEDPPIHLHPSGLEGLYLLQKGRDVNHNAVSDDANSGGVEYSRWQQVKLVFDAVDHDSMSSVGAPCHSSTDVVLLQMMKRK